MFFAKRESAAVLVLTRAEWNWVKKNAKNISNYEKERRSYSVLYRSNSSELP